MFGIGLVVGDEVQEFIALKTEQGDVRGVIEKARNGDKFASYYGIPFARPPVGEFRWKPPQKGKKIRQNGRAIN